MQVRRISESFVLSANQLGSARLRLLGLFPLAFFLAQAVHYWRINELGHMLWMCNIGNLVLAIGLFLNQAILIRIAVLWMVPGLVVWLLYVVLAWGVFLSSTLAHVGGIIVGLLALQKVRVDRAAWLYALLWYLAVQLLSRLITPVEMNVNVSQRIYDGWQHAFTAYWKFWLVLNLGTAALLWILGSMLYKLWPADPSERNRPHV
jgi:hypothetical protein